MITVVVIGSLGLAKLPLGAMSRYSHALAGLAIASGGSDEQRQRWLPKLATGDAIATVALGEAAGAWLPEQWTLQGGDSLSGAKNHVLFADHADLIVVGIRGGGFALVERAARGVEIQREAIGVSRVGSGETTDVAFPHGRRIVRVSVTWGFRTPDF